MFNIFNPSTFWGAVFASIVASVVVLAMTLAFQRWRESVSRLDRSPSREDKFRDHRPVRDFLLDLALSLLNREPDTLSSIFGIVIGILGASATYPTGGPVIATAAFFVGTAVGVCVAPIFFWLLAIFLVFTLAANGAFDMLLIKELWSEVMKWLSGANGNAGE